MSMIITAVPVAGAATTYARCELTVFNHTPEVGTASVILNTTPIDKYPPCISIVMTWTPEMMQAEGGP